MPQAVNPPAHLALPCLFDSPASACCPAAIHFVQTHSKQKTGACAVSALLKPPAHLTPPRRALSGRHPAVTAAATSYCMQRGAAPGSSVPSVAAALAPPPPSGWRCLPLSGSRCCSAQRQTVCCAYSSPSTGNSKQWHASKALYQCERTTVCNYPAVPHALGPPTLQVAPSAAGLLKLLSDAVGAYGLLFVFFNFYLEPVQRALVNFALRVAAIPTPGCPRFEMVPVGSVVAVAKAATETADPLRALWELLYIPLIPGVVSFSLFSWGVSAGRCGTLVALDRLLCWTFKQSCSAEQPCYCGLQPLLAYLLAFRRMTPWCCRSPIHADDAAPGRCGAPLAGQALMRGGAVGMQP